MLYHINYFSKIIIMIQMYKFREYLLKKSNGGVIIDYSFGITLQILKTLRISIKIMFSKYYDV